MLKLRVQMLIESNFYLVLLLLFFNVFMNGAQIHNKTVSVYTKSGQINGRKETIDNKEMNVFLGIPYAEPPIGNLRFRKPLPIKRWIQPIDANNWPNPCYQILISFDFRNYNISEDCLYLNIWSPNVSAQACKNHLRPVMFFIHGGAFYSGTSNQVFLDGFILSSKGDVVVVTINYRLDAFGFLYTGTNDAPGNMGLWDQSLALKWVNNNIKFFGGDPKQITIFGDSAGSWAVSLHLLSPISRNLFQNAIMMSGAAFQWVNDRDPETEKNNWLKGAQSINCTDEENSSFIEFTPKIIDCLRKADPELILRIANLPELSTPKLGWFRLVVIDGIFLPKKPVDLLKRSDYKKNVDLLIGDTGDEGTAFLGFYYDPIKFDFFNPQNLTYNEAYDELKNLSENFPSNIPIDGNEISKLYFNGLSDNNDFDVLRSRIGVALGDFYFTCPTISFAEYLFRYDRNGSKVFQYYYTNRFGNPNCAQWWGACHGSDLFQVFGAPFTRNSSNIEKKISEQMIGLFSHFAKYGYPKEQEGIEFPPFYMIDENVIKPYYEISEYPKPITNFGIGLKTIECEKLWRKYLDN